MTKDKVKIVFFGTPEFAVESLRCICEAGYPVAAVVTVPDKPAGRGKHLSQSAVKEYAVSSGLKVLQPVDLKDPGFVEELRQLDADLFVVIAFRILPQVVWGMPPLGTFNLHASLLPRYRGAAPINWAVINGDSTTGVTTFFLKQKMDTGDVIEQRSIEITDADNAGTVHDRLMELGATLTLDTIRRIESGNLTAVPQDSLGSEQPTPAPKIFKDTCHIDWNRPAREIHNLVRGLSPYPAAWSDVEADGEDAGSLKIFTTRITGEAASEPGKVTLTPSGAMLVDCGDLRLEILSLQAQGKRRMDTADYLRGCRCQVMRLK